MKNRNLETPRHNPLCKCNMIMTNIPLLSLCLSLPASLTLPRTFYLTTCRQSPKSSQTYSSPNNATSSHAPYRPPQTTPPSPPAETTPPPSPSKSPHTPPHSADKTPDHSPPSQPTPSP